jgi:hypothetical protein
VLTKTNYIIWRDCAKNAWLKVHKPEIYFAHELSEFEKQIIETGNEVELIARELFPSGVLVEERGVDAINRTKELMTNGERTIFQGAFEQEGYFAAVDILRLDPDSGKYQIYEIKATNSIDKKNHFPDLAFQTVLLEVCGLDIQSSHIIHLNPDYIRDGEIDIVKLFVLEDVTEIIKSMKEEIAESMKLAQDYIMQDKEPVGPCSCIYRGRSNHCTTFKYSNPDLPKYGVHDLSRIGISKRKLTDWIDSNIFHLHDIPRDAELTDIQQNQVWTHLHDRVMMSREDISEELAKLVFPLYFLDYETFPAAVPRFDGFSPYQQIPFQYSLHILHSADEEPQHLDFLYTQPGDPSRAFYESMASHIGNIGSVIVWHKSFECGRNRELVKRIPESKSFFDSIDARVFDLEDIFKKQHYVHKDFKGSSSIKKILPVLAPSLKYDNLEIREGGSAAQAWNHVVSSNIDGVEKSKIEQDLRDYCELDTYAMYAIWRELDKLINSSD